MLRSSIFCLPVILLFSSCITIGFEQPQPTGGTNLKEFPEAIIGVYDDEPLGQEKEMEIRRYSVILEDEEIMGSGELHLSDTLLLRKYKGYYIANWWDSNNKCWVAHPFKHKGNQLYLYNLDLGKDEAAVQLSAFTPIVRQDENVIVVDPTKKEFKRILKDSSLWETDTLYRKN